MRKIACDALFLAGAATSVYGLWLAWRPLGFIVGGVLLAATAFFVGYQRPASGAERAE